jgi:hypothetical protein
MLAATKPLSPLLTVCPTADPSLRIEHENPDDKIYDHLKTLIAKHYLLPDGRPELDRRESGLSLEPCGVDDNQRSAVCRYIAGLGTVGEGGEVEEAHLE